MDVFGSSGVRGVINKEMTPAFVLQIAQAAGSVWDHERAAVARDTRTSGELLTDAVASGLKSVGVDVDRLGVVPTPAAQQYAAAEAVPAVIVTASHNPPEFNGIKLVGADGVGLSVDALERIEALVQDDAYEYADWATLGQGHEIDGQTGVYIEQLLAAADRASIEAAQLTVALDPGHGAGCVTSPELFRRLGCRVYTVNATPDGQFPGRYPEPVADRLGDLTDLVRTTSADIGIAHDGDADRAVFVDETGRVIDGSASLAALAAADLSGGDTMVSAVNVSQRVVDVVEDAGAALKLTPIGATYLLSRIQELQAAGETVPVAGEGNGGIMFPPYRTARDGAYTAVRFLELVTDTAASAVVEPYRGYHLLRDNIAYETADKRERLLTRAATWADTQDGSVDTRDGYRIDFGDAWVLIRPSGTEPLVRIYAEATDRERARGLVENAVAAMED